MIGAYAVPVLSYPAAIILLGLLAAEDIRTMELSDRWTLCMFALGFFRPHWTAFAASAACLLAMLLLCIAADKTLPIGLGDLKLFSALAFSFGGIRLLATLSAAFLLSGLYAGLCLTLGTKKGTDSFPLVPFLLSGFLLSFYCCPA